MKISRRHGFAAGLTLSALWLSSCSSSGGGKPPPPSAGQIQLAVATYNVGEGSGSVQVVVTRTGGTAGAVTVRLATSDGTATSPGDYAATATTVVFADGDAAPKTTDIAIVDDAAFEATEFFSVTISAITGGAALGAPAAATVTVQDDDAPTSGAGRLNDTGVTTCSSATQNGLACNSPAAGTDLFPRQDAEGGRDFTAADDRDGRVGFSFTKLDAAGAALPDQTVSYAASPWPCLLDRVTGLTWEVRTSDRGLRDRSWTYSWYRSDGNDGGDPGVKNHGSCVDQSHCDSEQYQDAVNATALCGHADWRLPSRSELLGLIDQGAAAAPLLDAGYFPDALPLRHWTASPDQSSGAWAVDLADGMAVSSWRGKALALRLVRGGMQE